MGETQLRDIKRLANDRKSGRMHSNPSKHFMIVYNSCSMNLSDAWLGLIRLSVLDNINCKFNV